jgi:hypothetical protein
MCDTFVKGCGSEGASFFGKNSDRHPQEAQMLFYGAADLRAFMNREEQPPREYAEGSLRRLQRVHERYDHPYRALVSRPLWMWGAEMGVNEKGVSIGNEAVFSRGSASREGLLGMDILRLALHNAGDAQEALQLIAGLIETEGQGGNGAYRGKRYYDNSFLIRDHRRGFILETAGRRWAARPAATAALSNCYRLSNDFTLCDTATGQQVYRPKEDTADSAGTRYSFAGRHERTAYRIVTRAGRRLARSEYLLDTDGFDLSSAFALLRDHSGAGSPRRGMGSICMHPGGLAPTLTAGSMVVSYTGEEPTVWITAAPHPCVSLYQPWRFADGGTEGPVWEEYEAGEEYARRMHRIGRGLASSFKRWQRELRQLRDETESRCIRQIEGSSSGLTVYTPGGEPQAKGFEETDTTSCRRQAADYWEAAARLAEEHSL